MRIAVIGSNKFDSLESHMCDAFVHLGHTALLVDPMAQNLLPTTAHYWLGRFLRTYDEATSRKLARHIAGLNPDLVMVVYRHLNPVLVASLKKHLPGCPVAQVNPDTVATLERQQIIASDFDFYFSKEPYLVETLRQKAGLNAHYVPEGFNPRMNVRPVMPKPQAEADTNIDVMMYGNLYPYRARMAEQLLKAGIRLTIFGRPAAFMPPLVRAAFRHQYLVGEAKNQLLFGAKIVFNNFFFAEITSANQKYFEINGTGGFQLSDYKPMLEQYSGVPCHRVTYQSMDEAIEKIRHYLAHPEERYALAQAQYDHFQQYHTIDHRMAQVLSIIYPN